jgi:hypothetical protein
MLEVQVAPDLMVVVEVALVALVNQILLMLVVLVGMEY